jgi:hypothetical protein
MRLMNPAMHPNNYPPILIEVLKMPHPTTPHS